MNTQEERTTTICTSIIAGFVFVCFLISSDKLYAQTANGSSCVAHSECASGSCFPGPSEIPIASGPGSDGAWYCIAPDRNCALESSDGGFFGDAIVRNGKTLLCRNPNELGFAGFFAQFMHLGIESGLFTQNRVRQCSSDTACIGGDPTIEVQKDFDAPATRLVTTQVIQAGLSAQGATSAGYAGESLTPALSAYAYTGGPQRFTIASLGFQKYEFLSDGDLTISGTLTYSQSGVTPPRSQNPRGEVAGSIMAFQMDGDIFNPANCNIFHTFSGGAVSAVNAAGTLTSCIRLNGQLFGGFLPVEFVGLQNFQEAVFAVPPGPVSSGSTTAQLTVNGTVGDVFFLAANLGVFAHLGGFGDTSNTLTIAFNQPELVEPATEQLTFQPSPARLVAIDIKPGSDPNCVNPNGHGVIPVAILGSGVFDVLDIESSSLTFNGLAVRVRGKKGFLCHAEYVDDDEFLDLICKFEDDAESWLSSDITEASVLGALIDGREFMGTDSICIVP